MHDIVIPYKQNNSGELEACLKLIEKNVPHRNVHVVEQYAKSHYSEKSHINQILKLEWAINNLDLSDEFYLFNDDFFVMEPIMGTPYYHKGTLADHITKRRGGGTYIRALRTTEEYLSPGSLSYELHIPFLFDKEKLARLIEMLKPNIVSGKCSLIRSAYGNIYEVGGEQMEDVKNIRDYAGKTYLSTSEGSFRLGVGDYIRSQL